jgi:putative Mg2+ transporter-C (MgtC) family protein
MLPLEVLVLRLFIALALGALMGLERELIGKEAGVRTSMLVSGGAAMFSMLALSLPYIIAQDPQNVADILARNSGFLTIIGNIVVGIGFLGAGIIIKNQTHVYGLTTAAVIWTTAALGALAGAGMVEFAGIAAAIIALLLYLLRRVNVTGIAATAQQGE